MKVLYLVGFARSGTTLLGNLLGEHPGFFHAGEAWYLWERLLHGKARDGATALCGCGVPLRGCPVWRLVTAVVQRSPHWPSDEGEGKSGPGGALHRAPSEESDADPLKAVVRWQRGAVGRDRLGRRAFTDLSAELYRAIGIVTGADVVVDSSKLPPAAKLLLRAPGVSPYFVHIVRDPRGVLFSRQRRRFAAAGNRLSWPLLGLDAYRWLRDNLSAERIRHGAGTERSLFVRYEELATDPASVLQRVLEILGIDPPPMPFLNGSTARLGVNHTVLGNPKRFSRGDVVIKEDREWAHAVRRLDLLIAGALTAPLLLWYGYPVKVD